MPLPVIANTWRVAINWASSSGTASNVIHLLTGSGGVPGDLASELDDVWDAAMVETMASSAHLVGYDIQKLDGVSPVVNVPTGISLAGGGGSEYIPAVALGITLRTAVRGRSARGRLYLPFTAETKQNNGQVAVSSFTNLQNAWQTWVDNIQGDLTPNGLVVASYLHSNTHLVTTADVHTTYRTQRRRQAQVV